MYDRTGTLLRKSKQNPCLSPAYTIIVVSKSTHIFCKRIFLGKYEPKKQLGNYNIAASIFSPPYVYIVYT